MTLKIHWCPGHQEIEGNDLADHLARKSLEIPILKRDKFITDFFLAEKMKRNILQAWKSDWNKQVLREEEGRKAIGLGRFYRRAAKKSFPNFSTKPFNFTKFNRLSQTSYLKTRIGIGNYLAYLAKIGKASNDICNFCYRNR